MVSNTSVLIVEDRRIVAMDIQNSLESLGYRVCASVSTGEEAIRQVKASIPHLILMDIMLEGEMDGIQAAREIRKQFNIPVIYLTAYADEDTVRQAMTTEPHGYLVKPFDERELRTSIELALYKHQMETKLRENEQWLATTLNSIGEAVIATDGNGYVKLINPVAEILSGCNQEEILGKRLATIFQILDEKTREPWTDLIAEVIHTKETAKFPRGTLLIRKDGTERIIGGSVSPILDDRKRVLGTALVFEDLTEKRKMEEELLRAQKLDSIGALAGNIAHKFNNILTTITGYISMAQVGITQEDTVFGNLEKAKQVCLNAKDLTRQLLTFSEGGAPLKETTFISKIIRDSADLAMKGSSVQCVFAIPPDLWPVEIDKGQVRQAISNLFINAKQVTPKNGVIHVGAQNVTVDTPDDPSLKPGKYLKISIQDQGGGVPDEYLDKMFDPSFIIRQGEQGLGLATVYSIIHGHDGYVTAESSKGQGTTVHIYLPACDKEVVETSYLEGKFPLGKGMVLLMDDEEMIRDAVGKALQYLGYEVVLAQNAPQAVALYQKAIEKGEHFDAIILDLTTTGGMDVKKTLHELRQIDPQVKVVISSDYPNDPIMLNFKRFGFTDAVVKPYQVEDLSRTLHKVIMKG